MKMINILWGMGLALSLAACGGGDKDQGYTSTPEAPQLKITSTSFTDHGEIPLQYAAVAKGGKNTSPQLSIASVPTGTKAVAIIMHDEMSPCGTADIACVHWNVLNLPATKKDIAENENLAAIPGVILGSTYNGLTGYQGPNPSAKHVYIITAYALREGISPTSTTPRYTPSQFEAAHAGLIMSKTTWTGYFVPR
jgi:Raf kinase inhibitor-like YbhB/YbcL family protein